MGHYRNLHGEPPVVEDFLRKTGGCAEVFGSMIKLYPKPKKRDNLFYRCIQLIFYLRKKRFGQGCQIGKLLQCQVLLLA
jgi:hypothetical protein